MNPFVFGMREPGHAWLDTSVHELLVLAQREAAQRRASEVLLEHLLLGALVQNGQRVIELLNALGLEPAALRDSLLDQLGPLDTVGQGGYVPLSRELQVCVDQVVVASHACEITHVQPEQLLVGVLNSQWRLSSDRLIERLRSAEGWQELHPICSELAQQERRLLFYIQNIVHFLSRAQEATHTFAAVGGLETVKRELQAAIDAVEAAGEAQQVGRRQPQEIVLLGSAKNTERLLAEAVAYEMRTRLLTFSFAGLVAMCIPFTLYHDVRQAKDRGISTGPGHFAWQGSAFAQRILQCFFARVRHVSPCILLIEDIDAGEYAGRTNLDEICLQLYQLLCTEIERLTEGGQIIILATATLGIDLLQQRLTAQKAGLSQHFQQRLLVEIQEESKESKEQQEEQEESAAFVCNGCKREIVSGWKHCAYCGLALSASCSKCGAVRIALAGAQYCSVCGHTL